MILNPIESRRARRSISGERIPATTISRLFEAAHLAPSCFNNQPWRFIAVTEGTVLENLKDSLSEGNAWAQPAPLIVAVCTKQSLDCRLDEGRDYAFFDTGMAVMNLQLQAEMEGLIAHPIAGFHVKKAKKILNIPEDVILVCLVILAKEGNDALLNESQKRSEQAPRDRKPIETILFFETWK